MRTLIIKHLIRGIFFILTVLLLSACTGKNDFVLETVSQESGSDKMPGAEGDSGTEEAPDVVSEDSRHAGSISEENRPAEETAAENSIGNMAAETILPDIYVHICGAVRKPGVYVLETGSRVYEGIEAAGGFSEDACEDFINQAGVLTDGQRLVVPTAEEAEAMKADGSYQEILQPELSENGVGNGSGPGTGAVGIPGTGADDSRGLVNINTATESELCAISGIGAGKAAAIVKYRRENGAFASIEDIMKVSGIKQGTYEKIKDKITVNQ
ncbi:MAG: hypothetical protein HFI52_07820 [Lachnospiraceae bacterium]|nr:hypothetical protein [Lachnospiraceae bacterium]